MKIPYVIYRKETPGDPNWHPMFEDDKREQPMKFFAPGLTSALEQALEVKPPRDEGEVILVRCLNGGIGVFTVTPTKGYRVERAVIA